MKCNYQSWRSLRDGIHLPLSFSPFPPLRSASRAAARQPPDTLTPFARSSSTLAHNLYYGRGAHIINLIKRSVLKIVLLVRQLLTAVTFLSPSSLPAYVLSLFRSLTLISSSPGPLSCRFLYHLFSLYCYSFSWWYACYSHASRRYFATRNVKIF